jgi:hypothetical protein
MKRGLDWYKRDPIAFLGGVQGMSARHIAVYSVVLDLIYQHGGGVHNDPKWIAGWISDMGAAAVRTTLCELIEMGKLTLSDDGFITQERAENQIKTQGKLRENRGKTGKKGGEKSAEKRAEANKNNDLAEPSAQTQNQPEKRRVYISPLKPPTGGEPEGFAEWWAAYPKRDGANPRKPALEKYALALRKGASPDDMLRGLQAYAAEQKRQGKIGTPYIAQAVVFLNQERWRDYLAKAPKADPDDGSRLFGLKRETIREAVARYVKYHDREIWPFEGQTPDPFNPRTLIPADMLAEFGIDHSRPPRDGSPDGQGKPRAAISRENDKPERGSENARPGASEGQQTVFHISDFQRAG